MVRGVQTAGLLLGVALAAGCARTGTGFGFKASDTDAVIFNWKSSGNVSGSMSAMLADGRTCSGQFFQITSNTTVDGPDSRWVAWGGAYLRSDGWYDWNAEPAFVTHYSGRVLANLSNPDGAHIRCRFQLVHPADGMAGGGRGECDMPDGERIEARFPRA